MISLRVVHVVPRADATAPTSAALNLMRWLTANGHHTVLATGGGERAVEIQAEGFTVHRYGKREFPWLFGPARHLARTLGPWEPDLIHVHGWDGIGLGVELAARLRLPVVLGLYGPPPDGTPMGVLREHRIVWVLVPSEAARAEAVTKLGVHRDRVAVLPYGIDLDRFDPGDTIGKGALEVVGCFAGGTVLGGDDDGDAMAGDGAATLIDALALVRAEGLKLRGLIVNTDGTAIDDRLRGRIAHHSLEGAVSLVPGRTRAARLLKQMDVFVYPEREDELSLHVIKAMAMARPMICSAVGDLTELVRDEQTGLLVPPGDAAALAKALRRLVENPPLAWTLGQEARDRVTANHSLAIVGLAAHELYRAALTGLGGDRPRDATNAWRRASDTLLNPVPPGQAAPSAPAANPAKGDPLATTRSPATTSSPALEPRPPTT